MKSACYDDIYTQQLVSSYSAVGDRMGRWIERLNTRLVEFEDAIVFNSNKVPEISLTEVARCNIALKIYSSVLNCHVWFCPDEQMVEEILEDDPAAITYTVDEIMNLTKLNPSPEQLRRIHDAKEVFTGSKLINCNLDGENHDK